MGSATDTPAVREAVVEVATTVSPEVKIAAVQALLAEDGVEVTEVLRNRRGETLALVQRLLASAGIKGTFSLPEVEDVAALNVELTDATEIEDPKQVEIDEGLRSLVVEPINALSEAPEIPQQFKTQYENLPSEIKGRCTWTELSDRLLAQEAHYLNLATSLEEGGELVYIDEVGNPVFRDGGVEPVLKGKSYNQAREILYGKDYKEGTAHYGYEMPNTVEELREIERLTGRPFVASKNKDDYRATHMESGKNPSFSRGADFDPSYGLVSIFDVYFPYSENPRLGLVRLLRVKKMA